MHHICNFVRFCFNNNKNTTLEKAQKTLKYIKKTLKTCFLNFDKKHKNFFTSMVLIAYTSQMLAR